MEIIVTILVGLFITVGGGLILYHFFGIGKQPKDSRRKSTAILNNGKGNKFLNNTIEGFDVGIEDNGKDTVAARNRIIGKKSK